MDKVIYLEDKYFDKNAITNERHTVRVIIENHDHLFGYLKINGEDIFGYRNHLESAGGGIEKGESHIDAIHREVMEELGCTCEVCAYLGQIVHDFNILSRRTYANYYYVKVIDSNLDTHLTKMEETLFNGVIWMNIEKIKEILQEDTSNVGKLVHERELLAITLFEDYLKKQEGEKDEQSCRI